MWYMKDYLFERPDSDFPDYERYFSEGEPETETEPDYEEDDWIDDDIDERELFHA